MDRQSKMCSVLCEKINGFYTITSCSVWFVGRKIQNARFFLGTLTASSVLLDVVCLTFKRRTAVVSGVGGFTAKG